MTKKPVTEIYKIFLLKRFFKKISFSTALSVIALCNTDGRFLYKLLFEVVAVVESPYVMWILLFLTINPRNGCIQQTVYIFLNEFDAITKW